MAVLPSKLAEANKRPDGENFTDRTVLLCESSIIETQVHVNSVKEVDSRLCIRMDLSELEDAKINWIGDQETDQTCSEWPVG